VLLISNFSLKIWTQTPSGGLLTYRFVVCYVEYFCDLFVVVFLSNPIGVREKEVADDATILAITIDRFIS